MSLEQYLRDMHKAVSDEIKAAVDARGDDLAAVIDYVIDREGCENINTDQVLQAINNLYANNPGLQTTHPKPDYDMIVSVIQNHLTPGFISRTRPDDSYHDSYPAPEHGL